jgi:hypothetical protein
VAGLNYVGSRFQPAPAKTTGTLEALRGYGFVPVRMRSGSRRSNAARAGDNNSSSTATLS